MNLSVHKKNLVLIIILSVLALVLFFLPNPYYNSQDRSVRCKGRIIKIDNTGVQQFGMIKKGTQSVSIQILSGPFKHTRVDAANQLMGQMDRDKLFKPGDIALVVLSLDESGRIVFAVPQAHYRIGILIQICVLFVAGLILFGGWTGIRSFFSFLISALILWKILVPAFLNGHHPVVSAFFCVLLLSAVIIFLVAGFTRKGMAAFLGTGMGILTTCFFSLFFTGRLHLHGAVMPFSETLLYSGYGHLDITAVFMAGVFICAAGAVMDLAMDVSASMDELTRKKSGLSRQQLFWSGLRISRAVVGTMTTTLLFAYSGGYITLLMAFMAQGIPLYNMLNLIYVAAEVLKTLIGSIGLIMVGPFTAIVGAFLFSLPAAKTRDDHQVASSNPGAPRIEEP